MVRCCNSTEGLLCVGEILIGCPFWLRPFPAMAGEEPGYSNIDGAKETAIVDLRKRVQEALRTKLDDDVAVRVILP